jgi:hypothetical protein
LKNVQIFTGNFYNENINEIIKNRINGHLTADAEAGRKIDIAEYITIDWVKSKPEKVMSCRFCFRGLD